MNKKNINKRISSSVLAKRNRKTKRFGNYFNCDVHIQNFNFL